MCVMPIDLINFCSSFKLFLFYCWPSNETTIISAINFKKVIKIQKAYKNIQIKIYNERNNTFLKSNLATKIT
jgi:hypothetical protein